MVESGEGRLVQTLDDREDPRVHEAEAEVAVLDDQFGDPLVVTGQQVLDSERATPDVLEEAGERARGNEAVKLDEDRRRHDSGFLTPVEQRPAARVILVVRIQQRDEGAGVYYERNGGGS